MQARATNRETLMRRREIQAARKRLQRELGRYLLCVDPNAGDLNQVLYEQIQRSGPMAVRLQKCLDRLRGYPQWTEPLLGELRRFVMGLDENQRKARLLGSELDAALADPRWLALEKV